MYKNSIAQLGSNGKRGFDLAATLAAARAKEPATAHYVLCTHGKAAKYSWTSKVHTRQEALDHKAAGKLYGIVPASVGCLVLDIDSCPVGKTGLDFAKDLLLPIEHKGKRLSWDYCLARSPSFDSKGSCHIIVRYEGAPVAKQNGFIVNGYQLDILHGAQGSLCYVCIYDQALWDLAQLLQPVTGAQLQALLQPSPKRQQQQRPTAAPALPQTGSAWLRARLADGALWQQGQRNANLYSVYKEAVRRDCSDVDLQAVVDRAVAAGLPANEARATAKSAATKAAALGSYHALQAVTAARASYPFFMDCLQALGLRYRYNALSQASEWTADGSDKPMADTEAFEGALRTDIQTYCFTSGDSPKPIKIALATWADWQLKLRFEHSYHPVKEWLLQRADWDGTARLSRFVIDWFGADDTALNRKAALFIFYNLVRRVMQPGCPVRVTVVFVGAQMAGKSALVQSILPAWHSDRANLYGSAKELWESIAGNAIVELSELQARGARLDRLKANLTATSDQVRLPYDRQSSSLLRSCIFVGTTNDLDFLPDDPSGNTRFLPVVVRRRSRQSVDGRLPARLREQLFAEALHMYNKGYELALDGRDREEQALLNSGFDSRDSALSNLLVDYVAAQAVDGSVAHVTIEEFCNWAADNNAGWQRYRSNAIGRELRHMGYVPAQRRVGGIKKRVWIRQAAD